MTWCVGVLTWNAPEACARTVGALRDGLAGDYELIVLDNGSEPPLEQVEGASVIRSEVNHGAGGGVAVLFRNMLETGVSNFLFTEDDWTLERPIALTGVEKILQDKRVGQVRLGLRQETPPERYWTYGLEGEEADAALAQRSAPFSPYPGGRYQTVRLLWSNNPFVCRRAVAERILLQGLDELRLARRAWPLGYLTASTTPGHFRHRGEIRERRGEAGWKA